MEWKIIEFETIRGTRPVTEFIKKQQPQTIAKITHLIDLMEIHGSLLGMPHAKKLKTDLYELRVRGREEIRIIYGFKEKAIYLLHGFKKQKQKTPQKEIDTARQRYLSLT